MASFDEAGLNARYDHIRLSVHSSTQISTRTASIVSKLQNDPAADAKDGNGHRPVIVSLSARSKAANKLISIVEIAKRGLKSEGVNVYQYNSLTSELGQISVAKPQLDSTNQDENEDEDETAEADAFEPLASPPDIVKKRKVPIMTTYLSTIPINELRLAFGEQR